MTILFHDIEIRYKGRPRSAHENVLDTELPVLVKRAQAEGQDVVILKSGLYHTAADTFIIEVGSYYKTNQDNWPLLRITNSFKLHGADDDEFTRIVEVDLIDGEGLPVPMTLTAEDLKRYKPRPATVEDFEKLDIEPPLSAYPPEPLDSEE